MLTAMTAARGARTVGASSLVGALRRSAILEAFRRVRRSDYLVIGASRRFRAEQRYTKACLCKS